MRLRRRQRGYVDHCRDLVRIWEREVATREGVPLERASRVLVVSQRILGEAEAGAWKPGDRAARNGPWQTKPG